jgi:membrane protease YdiL (CAAX protease family)
MKKYLLILIGIALLLSEIILSVKPEFAFITYSVLIGGCLIALSNEETLNNSGKLIIFSMILPILRISELFLNFSFIWNTAIIYLILLFLVTFYSFKFKINPGYNSKFLILIPIVIILGITLGVLGNFLFEFEKLPELILILPILVFSEEVLFRGLIQNFIQKEYSGFTAVVFTSLIYGIFSIGFGFPALWFIFIISLIMSLIYAMTKNIYFTMVFSFIIHLFVFVL